MTKIPRTEAARSADKDLRRVNPHLVEAAVGLLNGEEAHLSPEDLARIERAVARWRRKLERGNS